MLSYLIFLLQVVVHLITIKEMIAVGCERLCSGFSYFQVHVLSSLNYVLPKWLLEVISLTLLYSWRFIFPLSLVKSVFRRVIGNLGALVQKSSRIVAWILVQFLLFIGLFIKAYAMIKRVLKASVLTPSQRKKWLKKKKSVKSEDPCKNDRPEDVYKRSENSDESSDPQYSSLKDLQLKKSSCQESVVDSISVPSTRLSENMQESSSHRLSQPESISSKTFEEPIYATVKKKKKAKSDMNINFKEDGSSSEAKQIYSKNTSDSDKNLIKEQKEEIKFLVERMKELTAENRDLHKNIERIIREEKWKEDSLHAELKLKISQLEADTHKEVKHLTDQIKTLIAERNVLTDQIHILHEEKQLVQVKYEDACCKIRGMVSKETMKKLVEEHEKKLNLVKKKHVEEIEKMQQENEISQGSKIILMAEVDQLKEKINRLTAKHEKLKVSEQQLIQERNRALHKLEESKQMQGEAQDMLLSLLKITETISIERDVLINKASFQDHQQKLLQTSIVDYSMNMGRLQEHFSMLSKERSDELQKLKSGEFERDENLKNFYAKQLEMLRSKVLIQSNLISDLENEKNKLEQQLESLWQVSCTGKSKVDDIKLSISTLNS